jgi:hypothetical protein
MPEHVGIFPEAVTRGGVHLPVETATWSTRRRGCGGGAEDDDHHENLSDLLKDGANPCFMFDLGN